MTKSVEESKTEDLNIVNLALLGNQEAYTKIVKKYSSSLQSLIFKMIYDKKEVDDLVQEAFIKAFSSLSNYNQQYAFSTWLFRIAINNTIDYIRKKKLTTFSINESINTSEGESDYEIPDNSHQADNDIILNQRQQIIMEAINNLPEKFKEIIELRHQDELSYEEISERLNIPIGTVKANLFRARELLNKMLKKKLRLIY